MVAKRNLCQAPSIWSKINVARATQPCYKVSESGGAAMVISKDSWHYQMYKWNRGVVDVPLKSQINLCPYVRTVLIWTPLLWLLFAGKAIPRVYNFFTWVGV